MIRIIVACNIIVAVLATTNLQDESTKPNGRSKRFLLDLSPLQATRIQEGLKVGKHIADLMVKKNFAGTLGVLVGSASKYFSAINPYFGLALSIARGASPELQLMRKMFTRMEDRFNQVDIQFDELRRQVAFVPAKVHLDDWKHNINAVQHELMLLSNVNDTAGYNHAKEEYIRVYRSTYESAGIKLYNSIMEGELLSGGLFNEFRVFRENDRNETQEFMLGVTSLLIQSSTLELAYATLNNDPNFALRETDWKKHIADVKNKMSVIDENIVNTYKTDLAKVLATFEAQNRGKSGEEFSKGLYDALNVKFYWRDWIVSIAGSEAERIMTVHSCDIDQPDNHGISIQIASVDKTKKLIDMNTTKNILIKSSSGIVGAWLVNARYWLDEMPDTVRNQCTSYVQAGCKYRGISGIYINHARGRFVDLRAGLANRSDRGYYAWLFG